MKFAFITVLPCVCAILGFDGLYYNCFHNLLQACCFCCQSSVRDILVVGRELVYSLRCYVQ